MKYIKFGQYAGTKIQGTEPMPLDSNLDGVVTPAEQAAWLTAMVESGGKFGTVMNYDGTGITAGIHQAVAVYPKPLEPGSLWDLLLDVQIACNVRKKTDSCFFQHAKDKFNDLQKLFNASGATFTLDAKLRSLDTGDRFSGWKIREILTGDKTGVMPLKGPGRERAEAFLLAFHTLFTDPATFAAQANFGIKHFAKLSASTLRFSKLRSEDTIDTFIYYRLYKCGAMLAAKTSAVNPVVNLAMSMYWSHTVNAPHQALKLFCEVMDKKECFERNDPTGVTFARTLIKALGTSTYGRWDDDLKNGRYQRTRKYAMKTFPKELFVGSDAAMPEKFS